MHVRISQRPEFRCLLRDMGRRWESEGFYNQYSLLGTVGRYSHGGFGGVMCILQDETTIWLGSFTQPHLEVWEYPPM